MITSLAPEGYFEVPTKWQEAKRLSAKSKLRGYPHHYTIFSIYNGALVAYPKFFWFSEDKFYDRIKAPKKYAKILGMRWKGQIKLRILNSGFALHENNASMFKQALTCDDIELSQTLKGKNQAQYLPIWLEQNKGDLIDQNKELLFFTEQLHEIVNNTPEGQRLLQEKKRRLEEEAGGVPREDSRVASLAEKVDEDLVVADASSWW